MIFALFILLIIACGIIIFMAYKLESSNEALKKAQSEADFYAQQSAEFAQVGLALCNVTQHAIEQLSTNDSSGSNEGPPDASH